MKNGQETPSREASSGARWVALGILTSRVFGLVRQKAVSWFFGIGAHNDVIQSALRLPNLIQNLLGEQALSAAFIPIYSRMLHEGRREEAGRFAGAVFSLLLGVTSVMVLLGVVFAHEIVSVMTAGFLADAEKVAEGTMDVDRLELLVKAVRITFPMTGFMVLAAWSLGVLNSHRRFFLPYMAPAVWNMAIITAVTGIAWRMGYLTTPQVAGLGELERWVLALCWGGLLGGLLQFLVQLPLVWRLLGGLRPALRPLSVPGVGQALRAFGPALLGRGVVQLGQWINTLLASFLREGAPGAINFAFNLINLPLAAFGMSVAAAELPELSRSSPEDAVKEIAPRLDRALRQAAFVIFPAVVGYLLFGFLVAGLLFRGGRFSVEGNWLVYAIVVGYSLGLPATSISRILQNTFYALSDTRTPAWIAAVRLAVGAVLGIGAMLWLDRLTVTAVFGADHPGQELYLGAAGLALGASVGDWCELGLLRLRLRRKVPELRLPLKAAMRFLVLAVTFALPSLALWWTLPEMSIFAQAALVLPLYPVLYLGWAWWRGAPELELWIGRMRKR